MIRRLQKEDREKLLDYLHERASYSVYFVADVLKFGFDAPHFTVWGAECAAGRFDFVLGRYYDVMMLYTAGDGYDSAAAAAFLRDNGIAFHVLTARDAVFDRYAVHDAFLEVRRVYLCELKKEDFRPAQNNVAVDTARLEDADEVLALHNSIEEFLGLGVNIGTIRSAIEQLRTFVVRENGAIVSMAMCGAATGLFATIGGVCTSPGSRGKGYASQAVSDLSGMLLNEGLTCSLSYDNPAAGAIYRRLGYRETGNMVLAVK